MPIEIVLLPQPDVRPTKESGKFYRVYTDYKFSFFYNNKLHTLLIPENYRFDGASTPRFSWGLVGILPDGVHRPAALIHDWLLENKGYVSYGNKPFYYTKSFANRIFYEALKHVGLTSWKAKLAYWAVCLYTNLPLKKFRF